MKNLMSKFFFVALTSLLALLALTRCSKSTPAVSDGVQVGNGFRDGSAVISSKYKIAFVSNANYALTQRATDRWILADNKGGELSVTAFPDGKFGPNESFDFSAPSESLAKRHPGITFVPVKKGALVKFHGEAKIAGEAKAIDYWLTPRHDVVSAVGDTTHFKLRCDVEGPVVESFSLSANRITVGQTLLLNFKLSDDFVGVNEAGGPQVKNCKNELHLTTAMKNNGNGNYTFDAPIDPETCPGNYIVKDLAFSDNAKNFTTLKAQDTTEGPTEKVPYLGSGGRIEPQVVTIEPAPAQDYLPVRLLTLSFGKEIYSAGEAVQIRFSTDRPVFSFQEYWGILGSVENPNFERIIVGRAELVGPNTYQIFVDLSTYAPGGTLYFKSFSIGKTYLRGKALSPSAIIFEDASVGNPTAQFVNPGEPDVTPPSVTEIMVVSTDPNRTNFAPGESLLLRIKANDDLSGISDFSWRIGMFGLRVDIHNRRQPIRRLTKIYGEIKKDNEGYYSVSFQIPPDADPGIYALSYLEVEDRAGNRRKLTAPSPNDFRSGQVVYPTGGLGPVPIPTIVIGVQAL